METQDIPAKREFKCSMNAVKLRRLAYCWRRSCEFASRFFCFKNWNGCLRICLTRRVLCGTPPALGRFLCRTEQPNPKCCFVTLPSSERHPLEKQQLCSGHTVSNRLISCSGLERFSEAARCAAAESCRLGDHFTDKYSG